MSRPTPHRGYTLVELLVVIAIGGIVAAVALPMYGAQMDSARGVKTLKHFDDAVRVAQQEFTKHQQRLGMGEAGTLPATEAEWITRFDIDDTAVAPGGGAAFVIAAGGDGVTGAIGVIWDPGTRELTLARPAYVGNTAETLVITASGISSG